LGASSDDGLCHETAPRVCALIEAIGGVVVAHPSTSEHAAIVQTLIQTGVLHAISQPHDEIENVCILGGSDATTLDDIGSSFSEVTLTSASFSALRDVIKHNHARLITYINTPIETLRPVHQLLQATNDDHIVHLADAEIQVSSRYTFAALANIEGGVLIIGSENGRDIQGKTKRKINCDGTKSARAVYLQLPQVTEWKCHVIDNDSVSTPVEVRAGASHRTCCVMGLVRHNRTAERRRRPTKSVTLSALNNGARPRFTTQWGIGGISTTPRPESGTTKCIHTAHDRRGYIRACTRIMALRH
jgi:hypothetical protein